MNVLAPICRAIHAKKPVAIRYHSMSGGESERIIVPFVLVDTGLRWHIRAFDRKSSEFRDFVVTRIEAPTLLGERTQGQREPGQRHSVDAYGRAGTRSPSTSGSTRDHPDGLWDE
ncbi:helix-turn-helix transcriptional regulator [Aeromonas hydrophila]|uniref:helix-turn-helix transcriptional regulator n=1 Tax=Aeromonas TaxID=642 RepID=UPI001CC4D6B0